MSPALATGSMYRFDVAVKWYPKDWQWNGVIDPVNSDKEWDDYSNNRAYGK